MLWLQLLEIVVLRCHPMDEIILDPLGHDDECHMYVIVQLAKNHGNEQRKLQVRNRKLSTTMILVDGNVMGHKGEGRRMTPYLHLF